MDSPSELEENLKVLLTFHDGKILLNKITHLYKKLYDMNLPKEQDTKLKTWLETFKFITIVTEEGAHYALLDQKISISEEEIATFVLSKVKSTLTSEGFSGDQTLSPKIIKKKINAIFNVGNQCLFQVPPLYRKWYNNSSRIPWRIICQHWLRQKLVEGDLEVGLRLTSTIQTTLPSKQSFSIGNDNTTDQQHTSIQKVSGSNQRDDHLNSQNNSTADGFIDERKHSSITPLSSSSENNHEPLYKTVPIQIISNENDLVTALSRDSIGADSRTFSSALDFEIIDKKPFLFLYRTLEKCFVIDVRIFENIDGKSTQILNDIMKDSSTKKLVHDIHRLRPVIKSLGIFADMGGCFDTQLAVEYKTGEIFSSLHKMARYFKAPTSWSCGQDENVDSYPNHQSLTKDDRRVKMAAKRMSALWDAGEIISQVFDMRSLATLERATDLRMGLDNRILTFDMSKGYSMASTELVPIEHKYQISPLQVHSDIDDLLNLLPSGMKESLKSMDSIANISVIGMDKGSSAYCWINGERTLIGKKRKRSETSKSGLFDEGIEGLNLVKEEDLNHIIKNIGDFGTDNRAGLERKLHRISCVRNRSDDIIGLTLRIGRHVNGNADMICDILFGTKGSILFLGEPGCGKTTIVREATRLLSQKDHVFVIDTSNEIAGDGDIPHPCVGNARRMMVKSLNQQASVMIECVQNHTPSVMVIDEIGREPEVEAARTCKQRGVRMVASAHGDLRKLVKNKHLRGLIGGIQTVTLGDDEAKAQAEKNNTNNVSKLKAQRGGEPVFDTIIELSYGKLNDWTIIHNSAHAVDAILNMQQYEVECRSRDPETGNFTVSKEMM